jgi:hypothetical protein
VGGGDLFPGLLELKPSGHGRGGGDSGVARRRDSVSPQGARRAKLELIGHKVYAKTGPSPWSTRSSPAAATRVDSRGHHAVHTSSSGQETSPRGRYLEMSLKAARETARKLLRKVLHTLPSSSESVGRPSRRHHS